jgi:urease subunit gamma
VSPARGAFAARPKTASAAGGRIGHVLLTPSDVDKLLLSMAGLVAERRRERGVPLNYPEAVAYLSCWVIERAREGRTVAELMRDGRGVLKREELMDGVAEMLGEVQVEATFPDGRKLVTLHQPVP